MFFCSENKMIKPKSCMLIWSHDNPIKKTMKLAEEEDKGNVRIGEQEVMDVPYTIKTDRSDGNKMSLK